MKPRHQNFQDLSGYCVHYLSGRTFTPKRCALNGECHHCAFDQWLDIMDDRDRILVVPETPRPLMIQTIGG